MWNPELAGGRRTRWALRAAVAAAALAVPLVVAPGSSAAEGPAVVQIQDRCDPATFVTPDGQHLCAPHAGEVVTLQTFLSRLPSGGDGHWRFHSDTITIEHPRALRAVTTGGEGHTFTEVSTFGKGILADVVAPFLNDAVAEKVDSVPVAGADPFDVIGPLGDSRTLHLSPGVHKFQCEIHPWMRAVVTVEG